MQEKTKKIIKWVAIFLAVSIIQQFLMAGAYLYLSLVFALLFSTSVFYYVLVLLRKKEILEIKIILLFFIILQALNQLIVLI